MSEKIEGSLQKAIFEVFETMFFLCPDDVYFTESSAEEKSEEICVKIESLGKFNFCLWLAYSESLLRLIAPGLFDRAKEDFEEKELMDIACESANMVGGAFLNLIDPDRQDKLNLPEVLEDGGAYDSPNVSQQYDVEGETLRVFMRIKETAE